MSEAGANRIGTALRLMAEDLVAERRRSLLLARENRELRAELDRLRRALPGLVVRSGLVDDDDPRAADAHARAARAG